MFPPPVFIKANSAVFSDDMHQVTVSVVFPSADPTIGKRGHVNHAHFQFAVWNVAHLLMETGSFEVKSPLAVDVQAKVSKSVLPNQLIRLEWGLLRLPQGKKKGIVYAEFYLDGTDTLCAEVLATFIDKQ